MFPIVPRPVEATALAGEPAVISSGTRIVTGDSVPEIEAGIMLASVLGGIVGHAVSVEHTSDPLEDAQRGEIALRLDASAGPAGSESEERYTLESSGDADGGGARARGG